MSRTTDTLRMPEHSVDWQLKGVNQEPFNCRGGREPGYAHMNPDGTLRCNRCGWVTPEPVITSHNTDSGCTYLTWDELVAAESNGYVVVGISDRPGTVPVVVGPFSDKEEARKEQARLRWKWKAEERREHRSPGKIKTCVRVLWRS